MTGAYLRVKRNDKWENIEVEHLLDSEREELFTNKKPEEMMKWFHLVCNTLSSIEIQYFSKVE